MNRIVPGRVPTRGFQRVSTWDGGRRGSRRTHFRKQPSRAFGRTTSTAPILPPRAPCRSHTHAVHAPGASASRRRRRSAAVRWVKVSTLEAMRGCPRPLEAVVIELVRVAEVARQAQARERDGARRRVEPCAVLSWWRPGPLRLDPCSAARGGLAAHRRRPLPRPRAAPARIVAVAVARDLAVGGQLQRGFARMRCPFVPRHLVWRHARACHARPGTYSVCRTLEPCHS